jgi:uncharacterized protein (UPF0332 family)
MPLAHDLLEQAYHLAPREPKRPKQASLRRAVSTSYYALFHLPISEATRNWKQSDQRAALGRYFQHGVMANASNRQKGEYGKFLNTTPPPTPSPDTDCMTHLQTISFAFYQAYQQRQTADYDIVKPWTRTQALAIIDSVEAAFKAMPKIRDHKTAQAYLFSLLGDPKGR